MLEAATDARVEDDDRQPGRQRHEPVLLGAAVEEKRVTAPCDSDAAGSIRPTGTPTARRSASCGDASELEPGQLEPTPGRVRGRARRSAPPTTTARHPPARSTRPFRRVPRRPAPLAQQLGDGGRVANPSGELRARAVPSSSTVSGNSPSGDGWPRSGRQRTVTPHRRRRAVQDRPIIRCVPR